MVFILVNAGVESESTMEQTAINPSAATTMGAFTSAQIERYSQEPPYMKFLEKNEGRLVEGATSNREICRCFSLSEYTQ